MTWRLIKIIGLRELRDLLRDRRTLFMIFVLPTVLYPLMGVIGFAFALGAVEQPSVIGIAGLEHLPELTANSAGFSPVPVATWLSLTPGGVDRAAGSFALVEAVRAQQDYPPLVIGEHFPDAYWEFPLVEAPVVRVVGLASPDSTPLDDKTIDLLVLVPPDFRATLDAGGRPVLEVHGREADERSRRAEKRLKGVVARWKARLQQVRLRRHHLPPTFDDPVALHLPRHDEPLQQTKEELSDLVARFFPFMLVMWAMAGALYPAIDVCAGEKERGTLETLLLSPARRAEIVAGKFLAVWLFSAVTALWNFAWLGGGAWLVGVVLSFTILPTSGLIWCAVLSVILSALFSAASLALGAYARSTKEGQYYLLPMFLVTLPLTFLPLVPGVELNLLYSLVPITGATLLLQKLMSGSSDPATWLYLAPVLLSLAVSIGLTLWWAVAQFRREEVLFREAERLDFGAWLRRWLGRKGGPPSGRSPAS